MIGLCGGRYLINYVINYVVIMYEKSCSIKCYFKIGFNKYGCLSAERNKKFKIRKYNKIRNMKERKKKNKTESRQKRKI